MIIKNLPQKTILKKIQLSGIGLHSGDQINIALKPAEENQGFVFILSLIHISEPTRPY